MISNGSGNEFFRATVQRTSSKSRKNKNQKSNDNDQNTNSPVDVQVKGSDSIFETLQRNSTRKPDVKSETKRKPDPSGNAKPEENNVKSESSDLISETSQRNSIRKTDGKSEAKRKPEPRANAKPNENHVKSECSRASSIDIEIDSETGPSPSHSILHRAVFFKDILMNLLSWGIEAMSLERTPYRCVAFRAHYNYMTTMLLLVYFYSSSTYYGEEPIRCIDHYDRCAASADELELCIQFSFARENHKPHNNENRVYATSYMWTHWLILLLAAIYKVVHICCSRIEDEELHAFHLKLQQTLDYKVRYQQTRTYFAERFGGHYYLIMKIIALHLIAALTNIVGFFIVVGFLGTQYILLPQYLLITRDFVKFDDPYSLLFPPFVDCEISPMLHIQEGRTNYFGCHLPLMEIYEKFFMFLWFAQVLLLIFTCVSLCLWMMELLSIRKKTQVEKLVSLHGPIENHIKGLPRDERVVLQVIRPLIFGSHFRQIVADLLVGRQQNNQILFSTPEYDIMQPDVIDQQFVEEDSFEDVANVGMIPLQEIVTAGSPYAGIRERKH